MSADQTRLAEFLTQLDLSQVELARRSRTSRATIQRARIVAALNARREERQQQPLLASDVFPIG